MSSLSVSVVLAVAVGTILFMTSYIRATEVELTWDAPTDLARGIPLQDLAGYKIYYGVASGLYDFVVDVGKETSAALSGLEAGQQYYFSIVAYDSSLNETRLSEEVETIASDDVDENPDTERNEDDRVEAHEADGTDADAESADNIESQATDQQHLDPDDAGEHESVNAVEEHPESDVDTDGAEATDDPQVIPASQLSIIRVSSEPLVGDGAAEAAIDGRVETFWRTEMGEKAPRHPHELIIALGGDYLVKGFRHLPRQDGKTDGMVTRCSFYVSQDGVKWGRAVATRTFSGDTAEREVVFPEKPGSFVRFVAHAEVNGRPWTSVAEITVLRSP
jgi:F5/8 type C domain/Fibronectin type III domain